MIVDAIFNFNLLKCIAHDVAVMNGIMISLANASQVWNIAYEGVFIVLSPYIDLKYDSKIVFFK